MRRPAVAPMACAIAWVKLRQSSPTRSATVSRLNPRLLSPMILADKITHALSAVLMSPGRSPEIPEREDAYGWLVGSWELEVIYYWGRNVSAQHLKGEAHF